MLSRTLVLKVAELPAFKHWIKHSRLTQGLIKRFIAGEDLETALRITRQLNQEGFLVALDYLGKTRTASRMPNTPQSNTSRCLSRYTRVALTRASP